MAFRIKLPMTEESKDNLLFKLGLIVFLIGIMCISLQAIFRDNYFSSVLIAVSTDEKKISFFYIFLLILGYYFISIKRKYLSRNKRFFLAVLLISVAILFLSRPLFSRDAIGYVIAARNLFEFHQNPYFGSLDIVSANEWIRQAGDIWWLKLPSPYGPLFNLIIIAVALPKFSTIAVAILFYKFLAVTAYFCSLFYFKKINQLLSGDHLNLYLFALNPAILIYVILDGHNDIFTILFLLIALFFVLQMKKIKSSLFFTLAVFIKYIPLIFIPAFIFFRKRFCWKSFFTVMAMLGIGYFIFRQIFSLDIAVILKNIQISQPQCYYSKCQPFIALTNYLIPNYASIVRMVVFAVAYLIVFYLFIIKSDQKIKFVFWALFAFLFLTVKWLTPWYILPLIPLSLLINQKEYRIAALLLTIFSLLHNFRIPF